jgi:Zn-dependent protease
MFVHRIKIFKILGFEVSIDLSWIVVAVLLTWSLASAVFPAYFKGLSQTVYWWMGIFGALGLFASIVVHEFSHSLVARKFGIPMKGITLFIFGGVAEMDEEPPSAKAEFFMALAGPFASIVIGAAILLCWYAGLLRTVPLPIAGVLLYLGLINIVLAGFNLVPAFPLDGGRVLRSVLWVWRKDLRWATQVAASFGAGFGLFLILLSVLSILQGDLVGGIWWGILGLFVRGAARNSYDRMLIRRALEGERVERFMQREPVAVTPGMSIEHFIDNYAYRYHHRMFPVVDGSGTALACITMREIAQLPHERWRETTVGQIARPCSQENCISPDTDAVYAMARMQQTANSRLMVIDHFGILVGILTLRDLLGFLSVKIDLDGKEQKNIFDDIKREIGK